MKTPCLFLYSFTFQRTPKPLKYVNQEKQDIFSCKHENTFKSMEFYKRDKYFCPPSVDIKILVENDFTSPIRLEGLWGVELNKLL